MRNKRVLAVLSLLIVAALLSAGLSGCGAGGRREGGETVALQLPVSMAVITAGGEASTKPRVFSEQVEVIEGVEARRLLKALGKASTVVDEQSRPGFSARIMVIRDGVTTATYLYDEGQDLLSKGDTTYKLPFKLHLADYRPSNSFLSGDYPGSAELAALRANMNEWENEAAVLTQVGSDRVLLVGPGKQTALGYETVLVGAGWSDGTWRLSFSFEKTGTPDPLPFAGTFLGFDKVEVSRVDDSGSTQMNIQDWYLILPEISRDVAKVAEQRPATVTIPAPSGLTSAALAYYQLNFTDMRRSEAVIQGSQVTAVIPTDRTVAPGVRYHWEMVVDGKFRRTPDMVIPFIHSRAEVRAGGPFKLYNEASPMALSQPPGSVSGGPVDVLDELGEWAQVRQGGVQGWIPRWYLDYGDLPVKPIKSPWKVATSMTRGLLYPCGPELIGVGPGHLVKPFMEAGDWVEVEVLVFDLPAVSRVWIPKEVLADPTEFRPTQGFIKPGSEAWLEFDQIGKTQPEIAGPWPVGLGEERDGHVMVSATAGWGGWTKKENITFEGP
ncbi:MAG: hypothetical protein ACYC6V_10250 [Bacillota bacterium]